jgi:hypothetical protein
MGKVMKLVDVDLILYQHNRRDQVVMEYRENNVDVDEVVSANDDVDFEKSLVVDLVVMEDDVNDVLEMVENDHVDSRDLMVVQLEPFDDNKH